MRGSGEGGSWGDRAKDYYREAILEDRYNFGLKKKKIANLLCVT
jgi:hypothetical protein